MRNGTCTTGRIEAGIVLALQALVSVKTGWVGAVP